MCVCYDVYMNVYVIDTGYIDELIVQQLLDVQIWLYTGWMCAAMGVRACVYEISDMCSRRIDRDG